MSLRPFVRVPSPLRERVTAGALSAAAAVRLAKAWQYGAAMSTDRISDAEKRALFTTRTHRELVALGYLRYCHFGWELVDVPEPRPVGRPAIPRELRTAVYDRDGWACLHCGATEALSLDHIHPFSLGGPDTFENLQTLCRPCNSRKGARVSAAA